MWRAFFDYSDYGGLCGLIVNMSKKVISFFSVEVDRRTLDEIMATGQKTVIQELEMMAVLSAMKAWQKLIKACRVVWFTDSEAVRGAFLKSWSANDDSDNMINIIFQVESDFDLPVWIERVPSQSNPSDILSRETVVEFEGAEEAEVDLWEMWSLLTEESSIQGHSQSPKRRRKCGCGKCHSHFPTFKKSAAVCMLFVVELKMHMSCVLAANVGPRTQ